VQHTEEAGGGCGSWSDLLRGGSGSCGDGAREDCGRNWNGAGGRSASSHGGRCRAGHHGGVVVWRSGG